MIGMSHIDSMIRDAQVIQWIFSAAAVNRTIGIVKQSLRVIKQWNLQTMELLDLELFELYQESSNSSIITNSPCSSSLSTTIQLYCYISYLVDHIFIYCSRRTLCLCCQDAQSSSLLYPSHPQLGKLNQKCSQMEWRVCRSSGKSFIFSLSASSTNRLLSEKGYGMWWVSCWHWHAKVCQQCQHPAKRPDYWPKWLGVRRNNWPKKRPWWDKQQGYQNDQQGRWSWGRHQRSCQFKMWRWWVRRHFGSIPK